jgi:hypothetical protein
MSYLDPEQREELPSFPKYLGLSFDQFNPLKGNYIEDEEWERLIFSDPSTTQIIKSWYSLNKNYLGSQSEKYLFLKVRITVLPRKKADFRDRLFDFSKFGPLSGTGHIEHTDRLHQRI